MGVLQERRRLTAQAAAEGTHVGDDNAAGVIRRRQQAAAWQRRQPRHHRLQGHTIRYQLCFYFSCAS